MTEHALTHSTIVMGSLCFLDVFQNKTDSFLKEIVI